MSLSPEDIASAVVLPVLSRWIFWKAFIYCLNSIKKISLLIWLTTNTTLVYGADLLERYETVVNIRKVQKEAVKSLEMSYQFEWPDKGMKKKCQYGFQNENFYFLEEQEAIENAQSVKRHLVYDGSIAKKRSSEQGKVLLMGRVKDFRKTMTPLPNAFIEQVEPEEILQLCQAGHARGCPACRWNSYSRGRFHSLGYGLLSVNILL
jgi:hypothetical protein